MAIILATTAIIIQPLALTVALIHVYGIIALRYQSDRWRVVLFGLLFGLGALAAMSIPISVSEGLIFDLRNLFIGAASGLLGPVAGVIALIIGVTTRLSIGGQGAMAGVYGMILASIAGLIWHYTLKPGARFVNVKLVVLGVMVTSHLGAAMILPQPFRNTFLFHLGPIMLACNICGIWLLGRLIMHENTHHREIEGLKKEAGIDPLTSLFNRRSLVSLVGELPEPTRGPKGRVMLYFDLDNFKGINDAFGHLAGDAVLLEISARIQQCLRPGDIFSRLGGDEFVVILPEISRDAARDVADRCRDTVNTCPVEHGGQVMSVTISIGATWADTAMPFDDLLQTADEALYAAKRQGRNRVFLHESFAPHGDMLVVA